MIRFTIALFVSIVLFLSSATADSLKVNTDLAPIEKLFTLPESQIDLAQARLTIESYIDPAVDVNALLGKIDSMANEIKSVPYYRDSTEGKLNGLIQYLYHSGSWNDHKPHHYDLDDPLGTAKPRNKLISNYLKTRKGNCVSMPILVQSLGERLGLDMSLSTAPLHLLVRLNDNGDIYNVEATVGGLKADNSYIRDYEITPSAIENKIYLQNLTKKQSLAVMLLDLGTLYFEMGDLANAYRVGNLMLKHYPNYVNAMHLQGNVWHKRLTSEIDTVRIKRIRVTPAMRAKFDRYLAQNLGWFEKAEALGWHEPPSDYDERYLKMIEEAKNAK